MSTQVEVCPICQHEYGDATLAYLPCTHKCHELCWTSYVAAKAKPQNKVPCPVCKTTGEEAMQAFSNLQAGAMPRSETIVSDAASPYRTNDLDVSASGFDFDLI